MLFAKKLCHKETHLFYYFTFFVLICQLMSLLIKLKVGNDKICELAQAGRWVEIFSSFLKQLQKNQLSRNTRTCNITQCKIGT